MMRANVITERLRRIGRQEQGVTVWHGPRRWYPGADSGKSAADVIAETPERAFPYPDIPAAQVAAYRFAAASETPPRPEFRPRPSAAPVTAPMAALPANAAVPPPPPSLPAPAAEVLLLRRVRDGLRAKWRAEAFVADMRHTTGLPFFRRTAHDVGWCGLDRPAPEARYARWTTERWMRQAMSMIAAADEAARSSLDADMPERRARVLAPQAGGAR